MVRTKLSYSAIIKWGPTCISRGRILTLGVHVGYDFLSLCALHIEKNNILLMLACSSGFDSFSFIYFFCLCKKW